MKQHGKLIIGIIFVLICGAIGVAFYNQFGSQTNEQSFKTVLADMQKLQSDLTAAFGGTTKWSLSQGCSQGHEVYTKGKIGCQVDLEFEQVAGSATELLNKSDLLTATLNRNASLFKRLTNKVTPDNLFFIKTLQPGSVGEAYKNIKSGITCGSLIELKKDTDLVFSLSFLCSADAQDFHFPRTDTGPRPV